MERMMKYPAILKLNNGCLVLATSLGCGFALQDYKDEYESTYANKFYKDFHGFESATNKTQEYLANTYGEVQSPEHAEFIIELAESHGYSIKGCSIDKAKCFAFYPVDGRLNEELYFYEIDQSIPLSKMKFKQITIPLPPKADKQESIEWPQIGDEVVLMTGVCTVKSKADKHGVLAVMTEKGFNILVHKSDIKKPKTPEEELREWVKERIGNGIANGFDCEQITHDLLHHLSIKKRPQ